MKNITVRINEIDPREMWSLGMKWQATCPEYPKEWGLGDSPEEAELMLRKGIEATESEN